MGITPQHADIILREHAYKELPKTVYLLGRQTITLSFEAALELCSKHGIEPVDVQVERDEETHGAKTEEGDFITDKTFFSLLGVENVYAIDCSDYEGAELVVDLNQPIDSSVAGIADFIFGGSVLDNIFNPATYIKNISQMLRPEGRLIDQNILSFYHHAYLLASPAWFFDYFVINKYRDCKIYISEHPHMYGLSVAPEDEIIGDFGPVRGMPTGLTLIAEKGEDSTWHVQPIQDCYRSAQEWVSYRRNLQALLASPRPYWQFSMPSREALAALTPRNAKSLTYLGVQSLFTPDDYEPDEFRRMLSDVPEQGIHIIAATYGGNQLGKNMIKPGVTPVFEGNVTALIRLICEGRMECEFDVDLLAFGDPAPQMAKELHISYVHREDPEQRIKTIHIPAEAHGQRVNLHVFAADEI